MLLFVAILPEIRYPYEIIFMLASLYAEFTLLKWFYTDFKTRRGVWHLYIKPGQVYFNSSNTFFLIITDLGGHI